MVRTILAVLVCLFVECFIGPRAQAQQNGTVCIEFWGCAVYSLYGSNCYPIPPSSAFNCTGDGPFALLCEVAIPCQTPPTYCSECANPQQAGASGGHPINFTNGNTYIDENDINLPGLGGGLKLERTWNSIWPASDSAYQTGIFGLGWISTYEERLFQGTGDDVNFIGYLQANGTLWWFSSSGTLVAPANVNASLTQNGTTSYTVRFQNGEQRTFDYTSKLLTSIVDRNGNTTTLTYDMGGRLITVTDPASRHLYFSYGTGSQTLLVTAVTSDFSVSTSYTYDSQSRLTQVTEPDGSTISFQFDTNSRISAALDSQGKILESHTYDTVGHGLTSSRANGVEAITVSYQ